MTTVIIKARNEKSNLKQLIFSTFEKVTMILILIMALAYYKQNGTSLEDRNAKVIFTSHTQYICSLVTVRQNYQQLISQIPQRYKDIGKTKENSDQKGIHINDLDRITFFFLKCKVQHFPKGKAKIQLELPFSEM